MSTYLNSEELPDSIVGIIKDSDKIDRIAALKDYLANRSDKSALRRLAHANMRLVQSIINKRFQDCDEEQRLDLIGVGYNALLIAISRYDPTKGYTLSTYLTPSIYHLLRRYLDNTRNVIRLPVHGHEALYWYQQAIDAYRNQYSHEPTHQELASWLGVNEDVVQQIDKNLHILEVLSLDCPKGLDDPDVDMYDLIMNPTPWDLLEVESYDIREDVLKILWCEVLKPNEREVLCLRYTNGGMSFEEAGKVLHITRSRAHQIESKAFKKLKKYNASLRCDQSDKPPINGKAPKNIKSKRIYSLEDGGKSASRLAKIIRAKLNELKAQGLIP